MATEADIHRALTPLPRRHLTAPDFESRSRLFNDVLTSTNGLETRACEDSSLTEIMEVRVVLLSAANAGLDSIYVNANDNRRLSKSTAGSVFVPQDAMLAAVMRDALCVEAVNLYTHHLLEEDKAELHELAFMPLMPELEHARGAEGRNLGDDVEHAEVFDIYENALICNDCHSEVTDETIFNPDAPIYPDTYYTIEASQSDGTLFDPTVVPPGEAMITQYSWPLRATRKDIIYADSSMGRSVEISIGNVAYSFWPETEECEASDSGFGLLTPDWLRNGPEETKATRAADEILLGVDCEVWERPDMTTDDLHTLYWSKAGNVPLRKVTTGGPGLLKVTDFVSFTRDYEIDPTIFALPDYCFGVIIQIVDMQCRIDNPTEDWDELCPVLPGPPVQPTFGNEALDARNGVEGAQSNAQGGMKNADVVGIVLAGAVFGAIGMAAAHRFKSGQASTQRSKHLLEPALDRSAKHYELGESSLDLSGGTQAASV
jgi:hypothetical protein